MSYLDDLADRIRAEVPANLLPKADTRLLFRLYALLAFAKGEEVDAQDVHDAWVVWMLDQDPTHRSIVPFDQLSSKTQSEDEPFVEAIRRVARRLPGGGNSSTTGDHGGLR